MKNPNKTFREGENPLSLVPKTGPTYEEITLVNPKKELLTPTILKTFEGFEAIAEEEAETICRTSLLFAQVLLEFIAHKNINCIDNQQVVYSNSESKAPVIEINGSKSKTTQNKAA